MALRFRVAGFPVEIHPFFFLMTLVLGASEFQSPARLAVWFCVVFISVLLHELGHALAFRRFGHGASIALHGMGGTTTSEGGRALTHRQDLWIALAGPAAGFLLGGGVLALKHLTHVGRAGGLAGFTVGSLLWVNIGWGLFNLLPVLPLDGGHIMAAFIRERGGRHFEWLIYGISLATAACGLVLSLIWKDRWLGMFALMLGVSNVGKFAQAWMERRYRVRIRVSLKRARPPAPDEKASNVDRLLTEMHLPSRYTAQKQAPAAPPERPEARPPAPRKPPAPISDLELAEHPHDSQFVGELLLSSGLPELAVHSLRTSFQAEPTAQTGHALVTALLETKRYSDLIRLLASVSQRHLPDETLTLIATRAEAAAQSPLTSRARELLQDRSRSEPLPARGAHDSKKSG